MSRFSEISAERLREAMERKNISASELVKRSGVSKSNISGYINGKFTPTNLNAKKIADALNVEPEWLMGLMPYDIDTASKYLAEISQGKYPQMTTLLEITQQLDDYFLSRLLAYAKKLLVLSKELEQSSALGEADINHYRTLLESQAELLSTYDDEYDLSSHESKQKEFGY